MTIGARLRLVLAATSIVAVGALLLTLALRGDSSAGGKFGIAAGCCIGGLSDAELDVEFAAQKELGATWVRFDIAWSHVERRRRLSDWVESDRVVAAAHEHGLEVLPVLAYTPAWARNPVCATAGDKCEPADVEMFAAFAEAVVRRYGPRGVRAYELWNEPNVATFWKPRPDPEKYAALVRSASRRMKAVDRSIIVIAGSTAPAGAHGDSDCSRLGNDAMDKVNPINFLERLYAAGAGASFDAISHHPYADPDGPGKLERCSAWSQMSDTSPSLRSVMIANGDGDKKIWGTEFGSSVAIVGEARQALYLRDGFARWKTYSWAGPLLWFTFNAHGANPDAYGLVREDGSERPAADVFRQLTG